jgi:hypothetical protein
MEGEISSPRRLSEQFRARELALECLLLTPVHPGGWKLNLERIERKQHVDHELDDLGFANRVCIGSARSWTFLFQEHGWGRCAPNSVCFLDQGEFLCGRRL